MKDLTRIYLKAARSLRSRRARLRNRVYTCNAISFVEGKLINHRYRYDGDACRLYRRIMGLDTMGWLEGAMEVDDAASGGENSEAGIWFCEFLLCMAAACWRDFLPLMEGK